MSDFEKAWDVVRKSMKEDEPPLDPNGEPSFYMNYSDSVDRIRDKTWEKGMGEISIPMRDRDNPHPLDGKIDDIMLSSNDAFTLWDEGYEPNYDLVIQSAIELLENMGYQVTPPNDEGSDSARQAAAMRSAKIGSGTASFDDLMDDRDEAIRDGTFNDRHKDLREHYRD